MAKMHFVLERSLIFKKINQWKYNAKFVNIHHMRCFDEKIISDFFHVYPSPGDNWNSALFGSFWLFLGRKLRYSMAPDNIDISPKGINWAVWLRHRYNGFGLQKKLANVITYIANLEKSGKILNVMLISINFKQIILSIFFQLIYSVFFKGLSF